MKSKSTGAPVWDLWNTIEAFGEALRFAEIAAEFWMKGPIDVGDATESTFTIFQTPHTFLFEHDATPQKRIDFQIAEVEGFLAMLRATQVRPFKLLTYGSQLVVSSNHPAGGWAKPPTTMGPRMFLEMAKFSSKTSLEGIFRFGPRHEEAIASIKEALTNVTVAATVAFAGTGPLSKDECHVLKIWRQKSPQTMLRYREVSRIRYGKKEWDTQENWTGNFLTRFAEKVGIEHTAPYRLLPAAQEREL